MRVDTGSNAVTECECECACGSLLLSAWAAARFNWCPLIVEFMACLQALRIRSVCTLSAAARLLVWFALVQQQLHWHSSIQNIFGAIPLPLPILLLLSGTGCGNRKMHLKAFSCSDKICNIEMRSVVAAAACLSSLVALPVWGCLPTSCPALLCSAPLWATTLPQPHRFHRIIWPLQPFEINVRA